MAEDPYVAVAQKHLAQGGEAGEPFDFSDPYMRTAFNVLASRPKTGTEVLGEYSLDKLVPVWGAVRGSREGEALNEAAKAWKAGTATEEQAQMVAEAARKTTWTGDVATIATKSAEMGAEFLAGGVLARGVGAVAGRLAPRAAQALRGGRAAVTAGQAARATEKAARGTTAWRVIAEEAAKAAPTGVQRALSGTKRGLDILNRAASLAAVQEGLPQLVGEGGRVTERAWQLATGISQDEAGRINVATGDFEEQIPRAILDLVIEDASEFSGAMLTKGLGLDALRMAATKWWMRKTGGSVDDLLARAAREGGWSWLGGEYLEEVFGDVLRAGTEFLPKNLQLNEAGDYLGAFPDLKETTAMLAAFGMVPAAGAAARLGLRSIQRERAQTLAEQQREQRPEVFQAVRGEPSAEPSAAVQEPSTAVREPSALVREPGEEEAPPSGVLETQAYKKARKMGPVTLAEQVSALGGIDLRGLDPKGEAGDFWERLQRKEQGRAGFPKGLIWGPQSRYQGRGRTPDQMLEGLREEGWDVPEGREGFDWLMENLEGELSGQPRLHPDVEFEALDEIEQASRFPWEEEQEPLVAALQRVQGLEVVSEAGEAQGEAESALAAREEAAGRRVRYADLPRGVPGVTLETEEGPVVVLRRGSPARTLEQYAAHESVHDAYLKAPKEAKLLLDLIEREFPERFAQAREEVRSRRQAAARTIGIQGEMTPELEQEEGAALLAELLPGTLTDLVGRESALEQLLEHRTFLQRILDALARAARAVGIRVDGPTLAKLRRALRKDVPRGTSAAAVREMADLATLLARVRSLSAGERRRAPDGTFLPQEPRFGIGEDIPEEDIQAEMERIRRAGPGETERIQRRAQRPLTATAFQEADQLQRQMEDIRRIREQLRQPMYHGTPRTFEGFSDKAIGSTTDYGFLGPGHYFTPDVERAKFYAGPGGRVLQAKLNIAQPFIVDAEPGVGLEEAFRNQAEAMLGRSLPSGPEGLLQARADLAQRGYDGAVVQQDGEILEATAWKAERIGETQPRFALARYLPDDFHKRGQWVALEDLPWTDTGELPAEDDYLYHVTGVSAADQIDAEGFRTKGVKRRSGEERPGWGPGELFLSELGGVPFWLRGVRDEDAAVWRVHKDDTEDVSLAWDEGGARDSEYGAYSGETRFALDPTAQAPPFYSALERGLEGMKQPRFSAKQLDAMARKLPGVTDEELQWVGWEELLRGRKAVTKEEALEWVRAHQVEVRERVLGAPEGRQYSPERWYVFDYRQSVPGAPGRGEIVADYATAEEALRHINNTSRLFLDYAQGSDLEQQEASEARHADYQLPGGERYRELLLTLPVAQRPNPAKAKMEGFLEDVRARLGRDFTYEDMTEEELEEWNNLKREVQRRADEAYYQTNFTGGHFDEPNVLAHVRFNERTDAEGKRVLFVEEVQSDWMQQGRKKGFRPAKAQQERAAKAVARDGFYEVQTADGVFLTNVYYSDGRTEEAAIAEAQRRIDAGETHRVGADPRVPDAPFKRSWPTLALKRMVKWAADNGFDSVAWTTGAQQVERYETALRQAVDSIEWNQEYEAWSDQGWTTRVRPKKGGKTVADVAVDKNGIILRADSGVDPNRELPGKPLEDLVGKSIAERILTEESGSIQEEGLTIGGKGMQDFYDKILVNAANKLGKRFGVRVGRGTVPRTGQVAAVESDDAAGWIDHYGTRERALAEARRQRDLAPSTEQNEYIYGEIISELEAWTEPDPVFTVHSLPITPDMRATVRGEGFSTFGPRFATERPEENLPARRPDEFQELTESVQRGEREGTRPDLAVTSPEPGPAAAQQAADILRTEAGQPGQMDMRQAQERGRKLAMADPRGLARDMVRRVREGKTVDTPEEVFALRHLAHTTSAHALNSGDQNAWRDAMILNLAYRQEGTTQARAFVARQSRFNDEVRGEELMALILGKPSYRTERELRRLFNTRLKATTEAERARIDAEIERLIAKEAALSERVYKSLRELGYEPSGIVAADWSNPATASELIRAISTARATTRDKFREFLYASMLSFPFTHGRNIRGNFINTALSLHVQDMVESAVNVVVRDPDSPSFHEARAVMGAVWPGMKEAGRRFLNAYKYEAMAEQLGEGDVAKMAEGIAGPAIGGAWFKPLRGISLTLLRAADNAFKGYIETVAHAQYALREAKKEGVTGETLERRVKEIMLDPDVLERAEQKGLLLTFQEQAKPGSFEHMAEGVAMPMREWMDKVPFAGTMLIPFVKTPIRLFRESVRRSPLVSLKLLTHIAAMPIRGGYPGGRTQLTRDLADNIIASLIALGVLSLIDDDDEFGAPAVGGAPSPDYAERLLQYRTRSPYSVRFFGHTYNYKQTDPIAGALATTIEGVRAWRNGGGVDSLRAAMGASARNLADATYLQGVGDLYELAQRRKNVPEWMVDTYVTAWMPNIIKATAREMDPFVREQRAREFDDASKSEMVLRRLPYKLLPMQAIAPPPKYDVWGREVRRMPLGLANNGLVLEREMSSGTALPWDVLLWNWNQKVARGEHDPSAGEKKWAPEPPDTYSSIDGVRIHWTDAEYEHLVREAGQMASERLRRERLNVEDPEWKDVQRVKGVYEWAKDKVRRELKRARQQAQ